MRVIVEGCLRSYVTGLPRMGNGAQQLKNSASRILEAKERVRDSPTQRARTVGQRCAARDSQRTHEITKVSFKNLSSPGNVKAFYNSTNQVGTFLFPLPFPLSPMLQLQRGQKQ